MNKLVPIHELFVIKYGINLELINLERCSKDDPLALNYVSRTDKNNGVAAVVKKVEGVDPNSGGTISVAGGGSVLSSFLQAEPYYSGRDLYVLTPKVKMTDIELLFYCMCIRKNKYKYNFGRQANRTLKDILVPASMPSEFLGISLSNVKSPKPTSIIPDIPDLNISEWVQFRLEDLFHIKKGKRLTKEDMEVGSTPFIGAIDSNNGYREFIIQAPIHDGNTITVNYNGSVAEAFYQPFSFWASDDVNVLYPKFEMNVFIALFIATIIKREKYRFSFGRKWNKERMDKSAISLPANNRNPDFKFMENYIKSLPYSTMLLHEKRVVNYKLYTKKVETKQRPLEELPIKKYQSENVGVQQSIFNEPSGSAYKPKENK